MVYKAEDLKLKRIVALKFLPKNYSSNEEAKARFIREAQSASALDHPNICTIHEIAETDDGRLYISMAYYDGETLKDKIEKGAIGAEEVIKISRQAAEGLNAAHKRGIIHRDVKPANIFIVNDGTVKILDFGLAKSAAKDQLTQIGTTIGTCAYMSPEQAKGDDVDARTDIWSLGVVMYEMIIGVRPFQGDYEQAIIYSILNEEPDRGCFTGTDCPPELADIIFNCLKKDKDKRYNSVSEIINDLNPAGGSSIKKRPSFNTKRQLTVYGVFLVVFLLLFLLMNGKGFLNSIFNAVPSPSPKHLAIMPLNNIGGGPDKKAFCSGLVETLSSKLTQIEQFHGSLWVVPAGEVMQNKITTVSDANKMYGINLAVTGSLQFLMDHYRLTLNLIDAENMKQLNSSIIDIPSTNIIAFQDKAVIKLLEMLHIQLQPQLRDVLDGGNTSVPDAYEYYVQGRGKLLNYETPGNIEEAIRLFKLSTEKDSGYALAYAGLGEAYWRNYNMNKKNESATLAVKWADKAFSLDSSLAPINVTLGIIYSGTGKHNIAVHYFKRALSIDPYDAGAFMGLASAYENLGDLTGAEVTYKKAINLKPDFWAGYNNLGVFYCVNGKYDEAVEQFKKVIKLTPDNPRGYSNLGAIYYYQERWSDAREMFEKALKLDKSYTTYSNLGTLYYIEGNYYKSVEMFEHALKINDDDYLIWGNLAGAYEQIEGKRKEAEAAYKNAIKRAETTLKINANDPEVLSSLAGFYIELRDTANTVMLINKAVEKGSQNLSVMYNAAVVYEHLGDRDKALKWIVNAIKNGYSRSEIEHQPELKNLTEDARYKAMTAGIKD